MSGITGSSTLTLTSQATFSGGASFASAVGVSATLGVQSAAIFSATISVVSTFSFGSAIAAPYVSTVTSDVSSAAQTVSMGTSCAKWMLWMISGIEYRLALFSSV